MAIKKPASKKKAVPVKQEKKMKRTIVKAAPSKTPAKTPPAKVEVIVEPVKKAKGKSKVAPASVPVEVKVHESVYPGARVVADHEMHTALEVSRIDGIVTYATHDSSESFQLFETTEQSFDKKYTRTMKDYPVEKAAALYASFARELGGSEEVMAVLAHLTTLSPQEIRMATSRNVKNLAATEAKKVIAAAKPKPVKEPKEPKAAKEPKVTGGAKRETAASLFQLLIMQGKLTDDKIFEQVQTKFGLSDSKRGYVTWYRNHLKKNGQNPPTGKEK